MQNWLNTEDEAESKKAYDRWMIVDPNMRDFGELKTEHDPLTGMEATFRDADVAMIRGGERTFNTRAYLAFNGERCLPHVRIDKAKDLQGWYQSKALDPRPGSRPRPCFTDAILTEPYGGYCTVGCAFCYINSGKKGYRGSGLITVPVGYGDQIKKQLSTLKTATAGYFSSFTDPFLPLETIYHNTQNGATAFADAGLPVFFLSRLRYPGWAFDLLQRNKYSYMQKSINTWDEADWRKLSPRAATLAEHMEDIREARRRGIYVSIQVNPVVAGIVSHDDVEKTLEMLAEAGANHVIVKFVEANYPDAPTMVTLMEKRFGANRAAHFRELFTENYGGNKTIDYAYRIEGHRRYQAAATRLGMTYATCYEYDPATKRSIGRDWATSDQCHGQRVPMFSRLDTAVPFSEVAACPPSGCLHCSDENAGKPRCGSDLFGAAKANRLADYKQPVISG